MHTVTEVLLALFLALGCAWLLVDLARKLRRPLADAATQARPESAPLLAPASVPAPAPAAATPAAPAPVPEIGAGVPPSHLVAIAAAVHHVFKGRARLASVLPAGHSGAMLTVDWAREGRRDIFTSHRVR